MKTKIKLILWIIISGIISQTNAQNLELVHEVSTPYKIAVSAVDTGFVVGAFNVSNQFYQFIDPVSGEIISTEIPYLLSGIIHQQNLVSTTYGDAYKLKEYVNNDWQDIVYINDIDDAGRIENQYFIVESQELLVYNNDSESFIDTVELDGFDSYISQLCVNNSGVFIGSKNSSANIFRLYDIQNQNIESLPDLPFVGGKSTAVKDMEFVDSTLYIVVSSGSYGGLHGSAVYKLNGEIWEQVYHYESDDTYNYATDFAAVKLENGEIYFAITTHDSRTFILRKPPENNPPIIETELLPEANQYVEYNFVVQASDEDQTDELCFSGSGFPEGISINTNGKISGICPDTGIYPVEIIVVDSQNSSDTLLTDFIVNPEVNLPPEIRTSELPDARKSEYYSFQVDAIDPNTNDEITFSAHGLADGLAISNSGLISGTPTESGTFDVIIEVVDSYDASASLETFHFVDFEIGIKDISEQFTCEIYPNPVISNFIVETNFIGEYSVYNICGNSCLKGSFTNSVTEIDVQKLKSGMYFITLTSQRKKQRFSFVKL